MNLKQVVKNQLDQASDNGLTLDTTDLQKASLFAFMFALGYTPADYHNHGKGFEYNRDKKDMAKVISFADAKLLHNESEAHLCMDGKYYVQNCSISVDLCMLYIAWKAKIIEKVYLQYHKKQGKVVAQKHLVKFV